MHSIARQKLGVGAIVCISAYGNTLWVGMHAVFIKPSLNE